MTAIGGSEYARHLVAAEAERDGGGDKDRSNQSMNSCRDLNRSPASELSASKDVGDGACRSRSNERSVVEVLGEEGTNALDRLGSLARKTRNDVLLEDAADEEEADCDEYGGVSAATAGSAWLVGRTYMHPI